MDDSLKKIVRNIRFAVFDFDGVFTDNRVLVLQDGTEGVMCNRSDGLGVQMLKRAGVKTMVLSKERNPVVSKRCEKLGIDCIQACDDKITTLKSIAADAEIKLENISYMGNDINDVCCLKEVGFPVVVADAYPEASEHAVHVTDKPGGYGAVRELCDLIISLRGEK